MNRNNANSNPPEDRGIKQPGHKDDSDLSHVPPELGRAHVEQARLVEEEIEEPIQQQREGRRKRRQQRSTQQ